MTQAQLQPQRKLRLGAFIMATGHHVAAWRHPGSQIDSGTNIDHYIEVAQTAERGLFDALIGPFVAFFTHHGKWAVLMLLAISLYRLPDFVMGPMANPRRPEAMDKLIGAMARPLRGLAPVLERVSGFLNPPSA